MKKHYILLLRFIAAQLYKIVNRNRHLFENPDDFIDDGFGSQWSKTCCMCGEKSMQVVRPGKAQCWNCG